MNLYRIQKTRMSRVQANVFLGASSSSSSSSPRYLLNPPPAYLLKCVKLSYFGGASPQRLLFNLNALMVRCCCCCLDQ